MEALVAIGVIVLCVAALVRTRPSKSLLQLIQEQNRLLEQIREQTWHTRKAVETLAGLAADGESRDP